MSANFAQAIKKAVSTTEYRMAIRKVYSFATEKPEANLWHFALLFDDGDVVYYRAESSKDPGTVKSGQGIIICTEKQGSSIDVDVEAYIAQVTEKLNL